MSLVDLEDERTVAGDRKTGFETDEVLEEAKRDLVYPKRSRAAATSPTSPSGAG